MLYTQKELNEAIKNSGYVVEFNNSTIEIHKDGIYISMLPSSLPNNLSDVVEFFDNHFASASEYKNIRNKIPG